jgi:hypothetical protein
MLMVLVLIVVTLVAGAYFRFNPAIPIFVILGIGIFLVGRIGGPQLPPGSHVTWGAGSGVYVSGQDLIPTDPDDRSGGDCVTASIPMIPAMRVDIPAGRRAARGAVAASRALLVLGVMLVGCVGALAQDAAKVVSPNAYPPGLQGALQRATADCKAAGGSGLTFPPDAVRAFDLTGGGRDDYIIGYHGAECSDSQTLYCGTGGRRLDILVTLPSGGVREVFSDEVRDYEILPGTGARNIRFELHGGYCGGHGVPSCFKTHSITLQPFQLIMP